MRRSQLHLLALLTLLSVFACDQVTPVAPVGSTITISVNPSRIDAEGETALVTIIVRKEDGTPVNPGTQVNISTTLGTLAPEVAFTDETGVAKSELAGDGRIGMATVSATTGAAALVSVDVQIGSVAASITVTATPTNVPKDPQGDEGVIQLLALIRDDTGAPLGGGFVNFFSEAGDLASQGASVVTNELGEARDTLTISRDDVSTLLEPFFLVGAETAIEGGSLILDEVEIDIRGVPALLTLQANPSSVPEAGTESPVILTALVRDNLGDPLEGVGVNFLTEVGDLASGGVIVRTNADGVATDSLTATLEQLETLGSQTVRTFDVTAQTIGIGATLLEDVAAIRVEESRPTADFECEMVGNVGTTYECRFTGTLVSSDNEFDWFITGPRPSNATERDAPNAGDTLTHTFSANDSIYDVRLTVKDKIFNTESTITKSVTVGTPPP